RAQGYAAGRCRALARADPELHPDTGCGGGMMQRIPVQLVTGAIPELDGGTALLRLPAGTGHDHADGVPCVACAAQTDVRALLYNLLHEMRSGAREKVTRVV